MKRKVYNKLLKWKNENVKIPYMLVGARQTGKTYILKEFCEKEFENFIYVNLESMKNIKEIFEKTFIPEEIIFYMETILNIDIDIQKTVIFIDEIQVSEKAINSLKYFCESEKEYKIICAGSLLGVKINRFKSSFPVGKVWIDYLYPMDFEEFLMAIDQEKLLEAIEQSYETMTPLLDALHQKALKYYYDYICIGGMPVAILDYIKKDQNVLRFDDNINEIILTSYMADMAKYTVNMESVRNAKIYNSIPAQLGKENKKFKYSLIEKSARAREYESSLDWLISSNMVIKCNSIKVPQSPLKAYIDENFKIYLSDMGLLRTLAKISVNEIISNRNMLYKGILAENYVAEVLYAKDREIFYWQVNSGMYEVDFLINVDGDIIPIEVKASDNTTSKSLNYYIGRYKPKYSIRISTKNFEFSNNIKSIPLYAVHLI